MKDCILTIEKNCCIAENVFDMTLSGDCSEITRPGQFINLSLDGFFLRRPISVCDSDAKTDGSVRILYKVVGRGTELMKSFGPGKQVDVLTGLGNGFDLSKAGEHPLLIGGGIGSAPMLHTAKLLTAKGCSVSAVLGFNTEKDVILSNELSQLGVNVTVATADGSVGIRGFVTDALKGMDYSYFYACGPLPMLKAVYAATGDNGELSFEERMGCGFGACVGCSMETKSGVRRVCKDGPVFAKEEILWNV